MANLYYNNTVIDYAWDTLGNWWSDASFTTSALALPTTGDTVYLSGPMFFGPSTSVTLAHIYVDSAAVNFTGVVGNATFNGSSYLGGTLTGDATFNDSSQNDGTVTGDATFTASSFVDIRFGSAGSYNFTSLTPVTFTYSNLDWTYDPSSWIFTTANPTWTFSGYHNFGTVTGDATFNGSSVNGGTVTGDATFNESGDNLGTVSGNATFNGYGDYLSYNSGTVSGNATFNGYAFNQGTVSGNATFNDYSYNGGSVVDATFNDFSFAQSGGSVAGDATFDLTAAATQIIGGYNVSFYGGVVIDVPITPIPNSPQEWGNYTYYAQGDVVSEGGFLWVLANTGGWTVGGRPSLGYGWQKLSTGGGVSAPQPINLAQLVGLPPFIQL
jgi:hypothetical protein